PQDNIGSTSVFSANDQPTAVTGIDMLGAAYASAERECAELESQGKNCLTEATALINQLANLANYFFAGISISSGRPLSNGSIAYTGARNMVLLSQTTTIYSGSQTLVTTTQTDYNDCSSYMNFDSYISSTTGSLASFIDCRDNPTQIREYDYNTPANNAV